MQELFKTWDHDESALDPWFLFFLSCLCDVKFYKTSNSEGFQDLFDYHTSFVC